MVAALGCEMPVEVTTEKPRWKLPKWLGGKTRRKIAFSAFGILGLAVYLNIGWALGTYVYALEHAAPKTTFSKILTGPQEMFSSPGVKLPKIGDQVLLSLGWPILVVLAAGSWLVYGVFMLCFGVLLLLIWAGVEIWDLLCWMGLKMWMGFTWLAWFVFWGGAAKLLGVG